MIVGFGINYLALGAFLVAAILTGQLMAVFLSNSGGAWDNAKKYIEDGHEGGKGSDAHKAAVIGDTVGDPFKDTAGPALNPLIKVMNLVSLLILPAVITYHYHPAVRFPIAGVVPGRPARGHQLFQAQGGVLRRRTGDRPRPERHDGARRRDAGLSLRRSTARPDAPTARQLPARRHVDAARATRGSSPCGRRVPAPDGDRGRRHVRGANGRIAPQRPPIPDGRHDRRPRPRRRSGSRVSGGVRARCARSLRSGRRRSRRAGRCHRAGRGGSRRNRAPR